MATLVLNTSTSVRVKYLHAQCGVRYWEDATVDGIEDKDGNLIPCRDGDAWCPIIGIDTGKIVNWKEGTTADIHYKVCDDGVYTLLNEKREEVAKVDDYVIKMMCPDSNGYGDYVIMKVGADGAIENWKIDLTEFEK